MVAVDESSERLITEGLITLAEAAKLFATRPNAATLWRWHRAGVRGVRLEACRCGGRFYTSRQAVIRFIAAQAEPRERAPADPTPRQRRDSIERARAVLDSAGI